MVATQEQTMGSSIKDHDQYPHLLSTKGKRTKRPRPPSPALMTTALTMSTVSYNSSSSSDDHEAGGATRPVTTTTATSSTTTISPEYPTQISGATGTPAATDEEEDMANCLILLAQGSRNNKTQRLTTFSGHQQQPTAGVAVTFPKVTSTTLMMGSTTPAITASSSAYECKTCNRCFPSFQALGGHRASHRIKLKLQTQTPPPPDHDKRQLILSPPYSNRGDGHDDDSLSLGIATNPSSGINNYNGVTTAVAPPYSKSKVHECSICGAEFSSGQALGGHMRRHRTLLSGGVAAAVSRAAVPIMIGTDRRINDESMKEEDDDDEKVKRRSTFLSLDLNLPAPEDDHRGDQQQSKFVFSDERTLVFSASSMVDCHY